MYVLKLSQNKKGQKFSSCTKDGVFFTAGNWDKDIIFGATRNIFGPSYFVTALVVLYLKKHFAAL